MCIEEDTFIREQKKNKKWNDRKKNRIYFYDDFNEKFNILHEHHFDRHLVQQIECWRSKNIISLTLQCGLILWFC
jgi:hypothetical protein